MVSQLVNHGCHLFSDMFTWQMVNGVDPGMTLHELNWVIFTDFVKWRKLCYEKVVLLKHPLFQPCSQQLHNSNGNRKMRIFCFILRKFLSGKWQLSFWKMDYKNVIDWFAPVLRPKIPQNTANTIALQPVQLFNVGLKWPALFTMILCMYKEQKTLSQHIYFHFIDT